MSAKFNLWIEPNHPLGTRLVIENTTNGSTRQFAVDDIADAKWYAEYDFGVTEWQTPDDYGRIFQVWHG